MTFPASQFSVAFITRNLQRLSGGITWDNPTNNRFAIFTDTVNPTSNDDWQYGTSPWNTGEVSGAGYTAGGQSGDISGWGNSINLVTGYVRMNLPTFAWNNATLTGVRGGIWYYLGTSFGPSGWNLTNPIMYVVNFGADYDITAGTLRVTWDSVNQTGSGAAVQVHVAPQP